MILYYNTVKNIERKYILKKFFVLFLVLVFVLLCFTGCKTANNIETDETLLPTNGIVVTADPIEETNEAEEALNEVITNISNVK